MTNYGASALIVCLIFAGLSALYAMQEGPRNERVPQGSNRL